ncbi:MAG TPA: hypothetical protein VMF31_09645 [Solirubrobacterales bacterium]|nr:hypothetical protein [Solirubrobacterales bacterium]
MSFLSRIRDRASSWRLPVRIPVPNRDNLIAMGLMALSLGLMVGVAIGPALGAASNAVAGIAAPVAAAPPAEPETEPATDQPVSDVELGSPAGSESSDSSMVSDDSGSSTGLGDSSDPGPSDTGVEYPSDDGVVEESPAKVETPEDPGDEKEVPGTELKGVTVGVDSDGGGYDIADGSGNVLALHGVEPPGVGEKVVTRIDPLANGTFAEVGDRKAAGLRTRSKLRGTVSWVDPVGKLAVISSRGSSLAVDLDALDEERRPAIEAGSPVESVVLIGDPVVSDDGLETRPGLVAESLKVTGEPLQSFDLNGVVSGIGANGRGLTVAADGDGLISAEIAIETPKGFDPALVTPGRTHNLTVERGASGRLTLIGLSPDYSKKVAADSAAAFGTHG